MASKVEPIKWDLPPKNRSPLCGTQQREGHAEVDYVVSWEEKLIGIKIKSGRKKGAKGLSEFKRRFPKADAVVMDRDLGERFLLAEDPRKFLQSLLV